MLHFRFYHDSAPAVNPFARLSPQTPYFSVRSRVRTQSKLSGQVSGHLSGQVSGQRGSCSILLQRGTLHG